MFGSAFESSRINPQYNSNSLSFKLRKLPSITNISCSLLCTPQLSWLFCRLSLWIFLLKATQNVLALQIYVQNDQQYSWRINEFGRVHRKIIKAHYDARKTQVCS
jgi:hypothetical protein